MELAASLIPGALREAEAVRKGEVETDESQPYRAHYAIADRLNELYDEISAHEQAVDGPVTGDGADMAQAAHHAAAWLLVERGLVLLDTDLLSEGEACVSSALMHKWPQTPASWLAQAQVGRSALGAPRT